MYPLVSIDLETTGLDFNVCQILEVGVVIDRGEGPLEEQPTFQTYVSHKLIQGEPFALSLNKRILDVLAARPAGARICCEEDIGPLVYKFLKDNNALGCTPTGKNFDKFDANFLRRLPNFDMSWFHRRTLDPGSMYARPTDKNIPSTAECKERAGIDGVVAHEAVADALEICDLIRRKWFGPDPAMVAASMEAVHRGDFKTTAELLAAMKKVKENGQLEAQRAGMANYSPGPRQAIPVRDDGPNYGDGS